MAWGECVRAGAKSHITCFGDARGRGLECLHLYIKARDLSSLGSVLCCWLCTLLPALYLSPWPVRNPRTKIHALSLPAHKMLSVENHIGTVIPRYPRWVGSTMDTQIRRCSSPLQSALRSCSFPVHRFNQPPVRNTTTSVVGYTWGWGTCRKKGRLCWPWLSQQ